ncbi:hypothetical protein C7M84_007539 [Penaeus vannamei]|uniref:Uncharacterized protein n=1 Tax=Penaeus vannamei TaxID=6689 RepID=A0A423TC14_PENVA|nr:hypothetical protein C7M84_007539 [Penaeus vannamei]
MFERTLSSPKTLGSRNVPCSLSEGIKFHLKRFRITHLIAPSPFPPLPPIPFPLPLPPLLPSTIRGKRGSVFSLSSVYAFLLSLPIPQYSSLVLSPSPYSPYPSSVYAFLLSLPIPQYSSLVLSPSPYSPHPSSVHAFLLSLPIPRYFSLVLSPSPYSPYPSSVYAFLLSLPIPQHNLSLVLSPSPYSPYPSSVHAFLLSLPIPQYSSLVLSPSPYSPYPSSVYAFPLSLPIPQYSSLVLSPSPYSPHPLCIPFPIPSYPPILFSCPIPISLFSPSVLCACLFPIPSYPPTQPLLSSYPHLPILPIRPLCMPFSYPFLSPNTTSSLVLSPSPYSPHPSLCMSFSFPSYPPILFSRLIPISLFSLSLPRHISYSASFSFCQNITLLSSYPHLPILPIPSSSYFLFCFLSVSAKTLTLLRILLLLASPYALFSVPSAYSFSGVLILFSFPAGVSLSSSFSILPSFLLPLLLPPTLFSLFIFPSLRDLLSIPIP